MLSLSGRIVALITHERLPTWVGSNMYLEVTCRRAGKITLVATKRLLSWMSAHVFLDGISLCAWIVTLVAGQRKICIGINLWKVSANTELCTMRFTLQTKTKKVGEKTHRRPMCASSFTETSHLNIHILFHTGAASSVVFTKSNKSLLDFFYTLFWRSKILYFVLNETNHILLMLARLFGPCGMLHF